MGKVWLLEGLSESKGNLNDEEAAVQLYRLLRMPYTEIHRDASRIVLH